MIGGFLLFQGLAVDVKTFGVVFFCLAERHVVYLIVKVIAVLFAVAYNPIAFWTFVNKSNAIVFCITYRTYQFHTS